MASDTLSKAGTAPNSLVRSRTSTAGTPSRDADPLSRGVARELPIAWPFMSSPRELNSRALDTTPCLNPFAEVIGKLERIEFGLPGRNSITGVAPFLGGQFRSPQGRARHVARCLGQIARIFLSQHRVYNAVHDIRLFRVLGDIRILTEREHAFLWPPISDVVTLLLQLGTYRNSGVADYDLATCHQIHAFGEGTISRSHQLLLGNEEFRYLGQVIPIHLLRFLVPEEEAAGQEHLVSDVVPADFAGEPLV